jgi:hypothetical protein
LVGNQPVRTATVTALEPTETLTVRQQQFDELRRDHPTIDRFLVAVLAEQVKRLSTQLLEALFVDAETRVLRRLVDLAQEYGQGRPGTVIPLTQEDIAAMAGTTQPAVSAPPAPEPKSSIPAFSADGQHDCRHGHKCRRLSVVTPPGRNPFGATCLSDHIQQSTTVAAAEQFLWRAKAPLPG